MLENEGSGGSINFNGGLLVVMLEFVLGALMTWGVTYQVGNYFSLSE